MKKFRKISIIIIVLLCILMIMLIVYSKTSSNKYEEKYNIDTDGYLLTQTYPSNFLEFYSMYEGNIRIYKIAEKFHDLIFEAIPSIYEETQNSINNGEKLIQYYSNNTSLKDLYGINNKEDFVNLCKIINMANVQKLEYESFEIEKDSCKKISNGLEFIGIIKYKNNFTLKLKITIYNYEIYHNFIKISPINEVE